MTQLQNLWNLPKTISLKSLLDLISNKLRKFYQKVHTQGSFLILRRQPPRRGKPIRTEGGSTK